MKTNMAITSLATYDSLGAKAYLQPKEMAVMEVYARNPLGRHTRQQISNLSGMPLHCVCGRVNSLVTKGALQETEGGRTVSGRPAKFVRIPRKEQGTLF